MVRAEETEKLHMIELLEMVAEKEKAPEKSPKSCLVGELGQSCHSQGGAWRRGRVDEV